MSSSVSITGLEEIQKRLSEIGNQEEKIVTKALTKAIEPIRAEMQAKAPYDTINKIPGHIKDNIKVTKVDFEDDTYSIYAYVTKTYKSKYFYARFAEWGSSKQTATPFIQPAFNAKSDEALDIMIKSLKGDLNL
jgi:HK97 gp10 family phage protein